MHAILKYTALLAVATGLASAQTFTDCNPTEKTCPNDPALCGSFDSDFTQGAAAMEGWTTTAGALTYTPEGAVFSVKARGDAPTIATNNYFLFGYAEVTMKAASGKGIISSIVLQSEALDEVDWEFIGGDNVNVQTNYFGKGNTTSYDRMIMFPVAPDAQTTFHTYAVNWTQDAMVWLIDGAIVRTLPFANALGGKNFPQTPMNLRIGIWAGGDPGNNPGTIEWAGGETDYTKAPFSMVVKSTKVTNYNPGKEYEWTDRSGSFQSIKTIPGECNIGAAPIGGQTPSENPTENGPGGFYPIGNETLSIYPSDGSSCTIETVTVTLSDGQIPTAPVPSVSVPDPIVTDTPTTPATVVQSSATETAPPQFTGAAVKPVVLGSGSLVGLLLALFAL